MNCFEDPLRWASVVHECLNNITTIGSDGNIERRNSCTARRRVENVLLYFGFGLRCFERVLKLAHRLLCVSKVNEEANCVSQTAM